MALTLTNIDVNELGSSFRTKINNNNFAISTAVNAKADASTVSNHTDTLNIHRVCNDSASASSVILWSSSKIQTLLNSITITADRVSNGLEVFAPYSHKHSIADLTDTTGMMGDYTGKTLSQTNDATDASQSHIDFTVSTNLTPIPRLTEYLFTVTFKNTTTNEETTPREYRLLQSQVDIIKPTPTHTIWTGGIVQATVGVTVTNTINGTNCGASFVIPNVAKYNYSAIIITDLVSEMKSQTTEGGFMKVLASLLQ